MFILDTLAKILDELSKQKKTQKELTDYLGIQKTAVTQWKLGKNNSYIKHISKIATFLNVSSDYLLGTEIETTVESNDNVKFALFGTAEVDDEIYEQVKAFAKFALNSKKENKDK